MNKQDERGPPSIIMLLLSFLSKGSMILKYIKKDIGRGSVRSLVTTTPRRTPRVVAGRTSVAARPWLASRLASPAGLRG